jgi:translation initiation factor IF-1
MGIEMAGTIFESLPEEYYRVELENGHVLQAYRCGQMRMNMDRVLVGDRVMVEMDPSDLRNGRILYRFK